MKERTAAKLTIEAPGRMTKKGRKAIAAWLRRHADNLAEYGDKYAITGWFTARYVYTEDENGKSETRKDR